MILFMVVLTSVDRQKNCLQILVHFVYAFVIQLILVLTSSMRYCDPCVKSMPSLIEVLTFLINELAVI